MNFKYLLGILGISLVTSFVYAKDDCNEIKEYLESVSDYNALQECVTNDNGEVVTLSINMYSNRYESTKIDVKKFFSYNTITDLTYIIIDPDGGEMKEPLSDFYIENIENLKKFYYDHNSFFETNASYHQYHRKIGKNVLNKLKNVNELTLKHINLSQDNIDEIATLTNLKKLNLDDCLFIDLNIDSISNLSKLTELTMSSSYLENKSGLTEFPEFVFSLKDLKTLIITNHRISSIPDKFSNLKNLEHLDLSGNSIYSVMPETLHSLTKLKVVDLTENNEIKGKALVNESLEECYYDRKYSLCKIKDIPCLEGYPFENCDENSITITTKDDCQKIIEYLHSESEGKDKVDGVYCKNNEKGDVVDLEVINYYLTKEDVNKILSYDTIINLGYELGVDGRYRSFEGYEKVPEEITKISNLEKL